MTYICDRNGNFRHGKMLLLKKKKIKLSQMDGQGLH